MFIYSFNITEDYGQIAFEYYNPSQYYFSDMELYYINFDQYGSIGQMDSNYTVKFWFSITGTLYFKDLVLDFKKTYSYPGNYSIVYSFEGFQH